MNKIFLIVLGILISLALTSKTYSSSMTTQKNEAAVVTLLDEVWSKGNLQIVDQLIAPQYTIRHDPGDPWEGKTFALSAYKERVKSSHYVFPDQKFYIEDLVAGGDKVAVSWRFTGTQKGNIPGLPATNKKFTVSGLTIYYFSKGKIIGHWQVVDRLGFLEQLRTQNGKKLESETKIST